MKASATQSNQKFQNGLNVHLLAFSLPKDLIQDNEEVRVSITTIPDENKQHFTIEGKKMHNTNHVFSLNITNKTKKIIMVFRKQTHHPENPIIASTTINFKDFKEFPKEQIKSGMISTEINSIDIYYPLQKQIHEEGKKGVQRKILGQMQIQLTFTTPYSSIQPEKIIYNSNNNNSCLKNNNNQSFFKKSSIFQKMHKNGKKGGEYEKLIDDNNFCDSYLM